MRRISATHEICHANASTWGSSAGISAARPNIAKGEDKGKIIPAIALGLSGWPTPRLARPKIIICAIVTGIDKVCTSRAVDACDPMPRNKEPISK